ncbi:lactadherin-like [Patiria miniata]|uniref:F5/8 type C domain-containing protein n=1 Tax=Patiria miniata TaxID=46514 RepID=A0A914ABH4_PATMI|nr:lactadherin-like [Patiria miniata]
MYGASALVLMVSAMAVLLIDVESQQRVCYSGPPPEPDPDNPDDWMKQVMQEIREICPGKREPIPAGHTTVGKEPTPAGHTTMGKETTTAGHTMGMEPTPSSHVTMGKQSTPAGHTTMGQESTPADCSSPQPLGMEDGTIQDERLTASSTLNCCPASDARLNTDNKWIPSRKDANPWIEMDLVESTVVSGVITQGSGGAYYVAQYKVSYQKQPSSDYEHLTDGNDNMKIFIGNTDASTPVTNLFDESVVATVVRIEPTGWNGDAALRLELLGCRLD